VKVVNVVFSTIDSAAEQVAGAGVWKVETIGDCYKAVLGGPCPCPDHCTRATALAVAISHMVAHVARRVGVPSLCCRVGVHTGAVSAAMVGRLRPRFLIYGPDVEIASGMESSAEVDTVQISHATFNRLIGE
ncbi:nucleotide cyclase, partial [Baffinella frigidus]